MQIQVKQEFPTKYILPKGKKNKLIPYLPNWEEWLNLLPVLSADEWARSAICSCLF